MGKGKLKKKSNSNDKKIRNVISLSNDDIMFLYDWKKGKEDEIKHWDRFPFREAQINLSGVVSKDYDFKIEYLIRGNEMKLCVYASNKSKTNVLSKLPLRQDSLLKSSIRWG